MLFKVKIILYHFISVPSMKYPEIRTGVLTLESQRISGSTFIDLTWPDQIVDVHLGMAMSDSMSMMQSAIEGPILTEEALKAHVSAVSQDSPTVAKPVTVTSGSEHKSAELDAPTSIPPSTCPSLEFDGPLEPADEFSPAHVSIEDDDGDSVPGNEADNRALNPHCGLVGSCCACSLSFKLFRLRPETIETFIVHNQNLKVSNYMYSIYKKRIYKWHVYI